MRAYKTVNDTYIEPISFTVPRRAETFQADIFPPATGTKPACTAAEWLGGKTGIPSKLDLESIYDGSAPKEVPSDYKPAAVATPPPAAKPEPKREEPKSSPITPATPTQSSRGPPPSVNDQKSSISAMANKYQDNEEEDEEEDEDETSSFEEISRPAQRGGAASHMPKPLPVQAKVATETPRQQPASPAKPSSPVKMPTAAAAQQSTPTSATSGEGVEASLHQIRQLIEGQTKVISAQNDKISQLVSEVESLKKKVSSGSQDQSERIRQLELELEEARS